MSMLTRLVILGTFIAACSTGRQEYGLTNQEREAVIGEVRSTLTNYYADIAKSGLNAEFRYLDNSPDFFWVPPGYSAALSYDSVAAIIRKNATAFSSVKNSLDTLAIFPLRKDLAAYTARLRSVMTDTSGNVSAVTLVETGTVVKRTDGWKLLCGQTGVLDSN